MRSKSTEHARTLLCTGLVISLWALLAVLLSGCAAQRPLQLADVATKARADLPAAAASATPPPLPVRVAEVLAEPAPVVMPQLPEPKLDLLVNNAQAREVFLAIVADTRYSMLMHPDVNGSISVTLRGVTVQEALESIRDVYGYDFKIDGRRITVYAPTLQTRVFTINYPNSHRQGLSELRVASGSSLQLSGSGTNTATGTTAGQASHTTSGAGTQSEGSRVSTSTSSDLWSELTQAVRGLVGSANGRSVVASPQTGVLAVRAMPDELRQVEKFLKAAQIAAERQVMLEAKIIEVELRDGYQSGIDWSGLKNRGNQTGAIGVIGGNAASPIDSPTTAITSTNALIRGVQSNLPGFAGGGNVAGDGASMPGGGTGLFGLALAMPGFQAVLGFLETQGDVQILSSPRIATLNNQKAVLKVGSEDFFVTNVTAGTGSTNSNGTNVSTPVPTLTPFFSGISLDVTPQIDDAGNIALHVHPAVTTVSERTKLIGLGTQGSLTLPLASSSVNESDTVVRVQDGAIVAIGGLMQMASNRAASGLPGTADNAFLGTIFGNRATTGRKREVVVLLKPSVIRTAQDWETQTRRARAALDDMDATRARIIQIDGSAETRTAPAPSQ